ncbi:putative helicase mot1 [Tolypocladium ophioglossoides CBS 100239]|uniref:NCT transcriptional regulatory complex subunit mot1 n=1 Tax=Tolypocladium ophioglossoides (strain CBS 100239) TaxID=1163406 RepID=A0A0L0NL35_TOLOC|nr:putative helicase mot1 [Tolypocladium ophioglossoides CBS 100239]
MASRLDRLVTILETGSTRLIRDTAVNQLADWQKQHPDELFNLLSRVVHYLRHKEWETRSTAAKAIGKIVENAPVHDPNSEDAPSEPKKEEPHAENGHVKEEEGDKESGITEDDFFKFESLDVDAILKNGRELLRGGGIEYSLAALDPQARLAHQKKTLVGRLGLLGRKFEDEEVPVPFDSQAPPMTPINACNSNGLSRSDSIPGPGQSAEDSRLSTRQLNFLKRKRKREAMKASQGKGGFGDLSLRRSVTAGSEGFGFDETPAADADPKKNGKMNDYFNLDRPAEVDEETNVVSEFKGPVLPIKSELEAEETMEGAEWPYERLCDYLKVDIFDSSWETRHGAAMGLREVARVHGGGAGRMRGKGREENDDLNRRWLNDLACRLCCVLMLDRFTDYSSDTSVAPIRETIGQTLGSVLKHVPSESVDDIYRVLYRMVMQDDLELERPVWAVCHGGMVGLRYVVAVRKDLLLQDGDMIDGIIKAVMNGLGDLDDDVRSVSAATLIPMAKEFVTMRPAALDSLTNIVWESLSNLGDDLSASTGRIMDLLATLCSFPEVLEAMKASAAQDEERSFTLLVPRLYPFLRHTITSVRLAVLKALLTFANLGAETSQGWLNGRILRLVFQNILVERDQETLNMSLQLWGSLVRSLAKDPAVLADEFAPHIDALMQLTMHPIGISRNPIPMNGTLFQKPSGGTYSNAAASHSSSRRLSTPDGSERATKRRRRSTKAASEAVSTSLTHDVDGHMMQGDVDLVGMEVLIRSRVSAAKAMGLVMSLVPAAQLDDYDALLVPGLTSAFASTQLSACLVVDEYAKNCKSTENTSRYLDHLQRMVESDRPSAYRDLVNFVQRARTQCQQLINMFRDHGKVSQGKLPVLPVVVQGEPEAGPAAFSIATAEKCVGDDYEKLKKIMPPGQRLIASQQLAEARDVAVSVIKEARAAKEARDTRVKASADSAMVAMKLLPKKPSPLIKGIMDCVKTEESQQLQSPASETIARLVQLFTDKARRGPADKVVANLVKFSCVEVAETPEFPVHASKTGCILSMQKEEDRVDHADAAKWAKEAKAARITRRGAKEALEILSMTYGASLLETVSSLRAFMEGPLVKAFTGDLPADAKDPENTLGQEIVDAMSVIRTMTPTLDRALHPFVMQMLPLVIKALHSELSVFRYMAAKCLATICSVITVEGMTALVEKVLPSITNPLDLNYRQGVIEAVYHLIAVMGDAILPYVIFLIVPVLGRMSDSDNEIRLLATTSFATLVKLVPLEAGIPDPPGLSEELLKGRDRERTFIAQLLDPKKVEPFHIPVAIKAELRSYQQEGVNWLHFLNKYHLHGILCDDMGLGKTLQTLCIVASDHHQRQEEFAKTQAPDARRLPSLIVCPPTLSGHWQQEIKAYAPFLSVTAYVGPPAERKAMKSRLGKTDIVITSYDVCRNDTDILEEHNWNYMVLDEGHLIKNPKAKITQAVKRLVSNHRLILTGTPIQNNVLELWSLFDFLMPGFLGAEKVFLDRFAKPIAASRYSKASSKEQEAGALAIEALHKQVLPFLLRRLKEEVLNDLPPKILQNYYCDLSDLQKKLFEDFTKKQGKKLQSEAGRDDKEAKQHIFQALQYMRKLCNSPALVMKPGSDVYDDTQKILAKQGTSVDDPVHAPKLTALRDLLVDCGIGVEDGDSNDPLYQPIKPHRALIFCQMKEMLDMVQNKVLKELLPSVSHLRLDGNVEANKRQDIVNKFNSDPSYDVLLLTTSVGGLGLNLTGADTVIFVEHDWNPQRDLQAMDRAHRIGQKKVVNVYRLITRGTLEEKILSLQRFKIDILDLFNLGDSGPSLISDKPQNEIEGREEDMVDLETGDVLKQPGKKAWLDDLGELWDSKQYASELAELETSFKMPVDYSKWDALELSDDSDVEVHPNVDKRSFIRAKQNQIHQERLQRKHQIETLKYERVINNGLLSRISALLASLKAHASEAATRNPGEIAFQAVMESAGSPKDDQPPTPPGGAHSGEQEQPTYSKMMAVLLDQVNKALDEKKADDRYSAMIDEIQEHEDKVKTLQKDLATKLEELEKEEKKKITSADIHTGFDSSHVTKSAPSDKQENSTKVELLNPSFPTSGSQSSKETATVDDDEEIEASPDAKKFALIRLNDYTTSLQFLLQHPHILTERETDGILVLAFDAALERNDDYSRQCVHQALLLQYCRALRKDGVGLFFKRITTKGHQAQEVFYKDVQDTYMRIKNRSREILAERAKDPEGEGVEQIQLHAVEPGTVIQINVPPADSQDPEVQMAREVYDGFKPDMKKALESGKLDEVNKVLGKMSVEDAEEMVNLFGEANVLSLEEQIIDATTEEGQKQLKEMEAAAAAEGSHADDPE